jgi:hypothetical protein
VGDFAGLVGSREAIIKGTTHLLKGFIEEREV